MCILFFGVLFNCRIIGLFWLGGVVFWVNIVDWFFVIFDVYVMFIWYFFINDVFLEINIVWFFFFDFEI